MHKVLVVGGGPAGMMAAYFAAREGASVTLLERNEKLGKKLYITGKGRCNLTNSCDQDAFLRQIPRNPRFLYSALAALPVESLMALVESAGSPLKIERGNRVFPVSDKASDITRALESLLHAQGVKIRYGARVQRLSLSDGVVTGLILQSGEVLEAQRVILATGGKSYPATGSTGDGYALAEAAGHTVTPLLPALVPLTTQAEWPKALQGLSLKNVQITALHKGKVAYRELGEMLFTHFGFSGPLILELSSHMQGLPLDRWQVSLDLKPGLTPEQLDKRLLRDFEAMGRKQFANVLPGLLPGKLAAVFPTLVEIPPEKPVHQISREERERMAALMKNLPLPISGYRSMAEAIITRGGVAVKEVSPATLESKLAKGLYFAGEILDVDGHTGGFNLQIAFSTGALAGLSAGTEA